MSKLFTIAATIVLLSLGASGQESVPRLEVEGTLCESVEEREPVGEDSVFSTAVGRVYCWTLVKGAAESTSITHVWHYREKEMARVELEIGSAWYRTWSYKTLLPEWTGDWRVSVHDSQGNPLHTMHFSVVPEKVE